MVKRVALTTIDNPYDPFDKYKEWAMFDSLKGYNSSAYLGRLTQPADSLSDEETVREIERAIDEIIYYDFRNIYKKVVEA